MGAIFDWEEAVWHTYKITQEEEEESTVYWIFPLVSNELFRDRLSPPPPTPSQFHRLTAVLSLYSSLLSV